MKLSENVAFLVLFAAVVATGCGWVDADAPAASTPDDVPVTESTDEEPIDDERNEEPGNNAATDVPESDPNDGVVTDPEDEVEPGRYYFTEDEPARCDGEFARCSAAPGTMAAAPAAALDYVMIADPVTDCDDTDEYFGSGDGIACAFTRLRASIADPIAPDDFDHAFVYEMYRDGEDWRIEVFQTGPAGRVVPSSRMGTTARSRWGFDDVTIEDGRITARDGQILVRTDYWGFTFDLVVRDASFEGKVSPTGDAMMLESGQLSGNLHVLDLFASLNQQASACSNGPNEPFTEDSNSFADCPDMDNHPDPTCQAFDHYCPLFSPFALVADVDLNDDGLADAFSVRLDMEFETGERRF